jgi:hypothetical protein
MSSPSLPAVVSPRSEGGEHLDTSQPAPTSTTTAESPASPSRRALTFEEFRQFYVTSKRSSFLHKRHLHDDTVYHPHEIDQLREEEAVVERERRRVLAMDLCNDLTALMRDRNTGGGASSARPIHVVDNLHPDRGEALQPPPTPPLQRPAPPPPPGMMARAGGAVGGAAQWAVQHITENFMHLLQFALLGCLMYSQSEGGGVFVIALMIIFAIFAVLRAVVRNCKIGRETGTVAAPSFLGRLFKPEGQQGLVSLPRRMGYIVAKCIEAFVLSISPTYSVERLESELQVDGIVHQGE